MDWTSPQNVARAQLNNEQIQFMQETAEQIKEKGTNFDADSTTNMLTRGS